MAAAAEITDQVSWEEVAAAVVVIRHLDFHQYLLLDLMLGLEIGIARSAVAVHITLLAVPAALSAVHLKMKPLLALTPPITCLELEV